MVEQLRLGDSDALIALTNAWEKALALLAPEINRPSFESFFRTARPISMEQDTATIGAASELARIFLQKYAELVKTALESIFGSEIEVAFVVAPPEQPKARARKAEESRPEGGILSPVSLPLNDKYTFDSFIIGPCNRLAHAAAQAIAERPGQVYNPFFLYGGPGLGKTHLLQAIGHRILADHSGMRVAYVSGEQFTQHYVMALRDRRSEEFRRKYRGIDVWLVDDVQFLAGKERTKEEFFHTFNALYQMNKQVVLSSDRPPRDLGPLEGRLKSRFEAGLVADVSPPDLETRIAILRNKAQAEEAGISPRVIECVASLIPTNIRALEGALVTLLAYSSLMKAPLTPSLAEEVLGRYLVERKCAELSPDMILRAVAEAFDVDAEAIRGRRRTKDIVTARHVAVYLARELTGLSLHAIGKAFGGRDHSTTSHACREVRKLMEQDQALRATVERLTGDLRSAAL